jgi:hypothetical protein
MIFATTMMTGLASALLRSAFAVIFVAFMIMMIFATTWLISGTGVMALLIAIAGFNAGLILMALAYVIRGRAHAAE